MTLSRLPYTFEEALAEVKSWRSSHIPAGDIRALKHRIHELESEVIGYKRILQEAETAAQRKPLTDDVLVPLEILEAAASSLDSFCGDLGWGDADLQNMDNLFALISQHKAAHNIKEGT